MIDNTTIDNLSIIYHYFDILERAQALLTPPSSGYSREYEYGVLIHFIFYFKLKLELPY